MHCFGTAGIDYQVNKDLKICVYGEFKAKYNEKNIADKEKVGEIVQDLR